MPTTRAMEAQFQTLPEKLTEMKSDLTASMNANMGEMKSELTTNIAEVNTKLTNVNEQISANKEELKSDLKGIGDKLTTMDKKFKKMEGRIESVENKFEDMESKLEAKIFEKVEDVSISFRSDLEKLKQKVMTGQADEFKFQAPYSKPSIKLSTYDGKSSWQVYKTQFSIVADANQWDSQTKACQLAASLRADAADILQTLPETQRLDFDALVNALELRFGEKCVKDYSRLQLKSRQQKVSETLQELATDVERLSHLAFSDCPTEVREVLALQHFIDGVRDPEIQKALRMADLKDLKGTLVFAMKFEAAQQATRKDRHPIRAVNESDTSNSSVERLERQMRSFMNRVESLMSQKADGKKTLKCWTCGGEGHLQRSCRACQGAETNSASQKGGVGKLINGHLVGRRLPDFGKPHFQVCQISTKSTGENGIFIMGHVYELPCNMIIDTGANVSIIRNDLAQKLKEKLIWTPPRVVLQTVTGEKIDIHGKLKVKIKFGDTTYQHAVYVADIADPFILGLDFLKEHGFTLDFNKNELRSIHEEVTIFKIEHRTESIRQKGEVLATCSPVTCVCKSSSLLLSNSPQQLTPDLLENAELSPEQKSSAERLFQEFEDVFSRNSSDIGHTTVTQHRIDTADHPPIKQHPRRLPFAKQEEVGILLREMQENDIIEPSSSPWASPIVLVRKKDGSTRFCVDYRKLNDVTKKDSYPLPRIDDTLDTLSGHKWFSTLDLKSGYWQVEIHPEDREKQHPRRLPFAKQEEVGTLLREMQENDIIEPSSSPWASPIVLVRKKDGSTRFCVDYRKLNDVTKKDSYPLPRIDDTLDTLSGHKWFSTLDLKSGYWQVEIHPEDREKQHSLPARTMAVQSHAVRALQCASYFRAPDGDRGRTFEEHLQNIRKVLSKLSDANLKLNPSKCKFFQKEVNYLGHIISAEGVRTDPEKVSAVKNWKRPENLPLTSSPILIYPQPDKPFILDTDASNESVGAVLSQEIDGQERVVAYWSKCLSKPERNYCVTRKELLAIVKAIEHFHHYLYGQKFLLRTDHASLTWLMNFRNTEGQVARWIQRLNEYYFDIRHRKGSSHGNADALSRRPCPENCRHCSRVETKYDYAIRQITTSTATPPDPWSDKKVRRRPDGGS
ncbi:retrovirus-related Pol polyprotein from transposon 297 [Trichonephila clavipes]|uniref:RNA-directed DNA polymerase n=1 Tax=Trichonephila clavipes TaxID=2585209 RepID=A0A8X6SUG4_TRICX|nr:retrovirus-related Pol polyprotein from transposon 297 [Trichonephila clavipes]